MAYTTVDKSSAHFENKLWTGNGSTQTITGLEFQPDMAWIKARTTTGWHDITDAVRGVTKSIFPNDAGAEDTSATALTAFTSDGYSLGSNSQVNGNGTPYVGWNWKANGQGSSNTDGSINTTYTSANTTAGISIVKYTGTGSNATVGHGLGAAPKMILFKDTTNASTNWSIYHKNIGNDYRLTLNENYAKQGSDSTYYQSTDPSSSLIYLGSNSRANASGAVTIAYCFAEKQGFSKFGSWNGNSNSDGPFLYCGFKPAWLLFKRTDTTGNFVIVDNKRNNSFNTQDRLLFPNTNAAEDGSGETYYWDFVSNGIKIRTTSGSYGNSSSNTYIYMAFAEAPLVGSNDIPATAR